MDGRRGRMCSRCALHHAAASTRRQSPPQHPRVLRQCWRCDALKSAQWQCACCSASVKGVDADCRPARCCKRFGCNARAVVASTPHLKRAVCLAQGCWAASRRRMCRACCRRCCVACRKTCRCRRCAFVFPCSYGQVTRRQCLRWSGSLKLMHLAPCTCAMSPSECAVVQLPAGLCASLPRHPAARALTVSARCSKQSLAAAQELLAACRQSDDAGGPLLAARDAAARGIAAALQEAAAAARLLLPPDHAQKGSRHGRWGAALSAALAAKARTFRQPPRHRLCTCHERGPRRRLTPAAHHHHACAGFCTGSRSLLPASKCSCRGGTRRDLSTRWSWRRGRCRRSRC